jgi:hypothetical protein
MMKTPLRVIGLLALFSVSLPAWSMAEDGDGNSLLSVCGVAVAFVDAQSLQSLNSVDVGFCFGLMEGMMAMNQIYEYRLKNALFCQPKSITSAQAARIVVKYLRDHPEELHQPGSILAYVALSEAFPCAKQ